MHDFQYEGCEGEGRPPGNSSWTNYARHEFKGVILKRNPDPEVELLFRDPDEWSPNGVRQTGCSDSLGPPLTSLAE